MDAVFKAISDPSRRLLMDRLFEEDGQTLGELSVALPEMTRFGVMSHLKVLEEAGLISARKVGRNKHHYLDPAPIEEIHRRWVAKYTGQLLDRMAAVKSRAEERS